MTVGLAKLIVSFMKQNNARALNLLSRQLKMKPRVMLEKASEIARRPSANLPHTKKLLQSPKQKRPTRFHRYGRGRETR